MAAGTVIRALALAGLAALPCSCASTEGLRRAIKAPPTAPSPFLEEPGRMVTGDSATGPFHAVWDGATDTQRARSQARGEIYVAPVETRYLREITKGLTRRQQRLWGRRRPVDATAEQLRSEFARAFRESPRPRYRVVDAPTPDSVTLELALVELDPTSVTATAARKVASAALTPAAGAAGLLTKGCIAIEGKVRDTEGGWLVFQFADKERDKMTLWTLRDLRPYGHTAVAIREWAAQFEQLTRDPRWQQMEDSPAITLRPW